MENNLDNILKDTIITEINWAIENNTKAEWKHFGTNICFNSIDTELIIQELKEIPTNRVITILQEVHNVVKNKKRAVLAIKYIIDKLEEDRYIDINLN